MLYLMKFARVLAIDIDLLALVHAAGVNYSALNNC